MSGIGAPREEAPLSCPSAQPGMEDARIFGVLSGSAAEPRVDFLKQKAVVTDELMDELGGIDPTLVFRFSAKCAGGACAQFGNGQCSLGKRLVQRLDPVTDRLPSCVIRPTCRWHEEQGNAACYRCPQVVTKVSEADPLSMQLGPPPTATAPAENRA